MMKRCTIIILILTLATSIRAQKFDDYFADATLLQHFEGMKRLLGSGKTVINTGQQVTVYITSAPEEILRKMVFQKRKHNLGSLFLSVIRIRGVAV